jgi:ATP adenylyltransferase
MTSGSPGAELDRLWAGWRTEYVSGPAANPSTHPGDCVFCRILASGLSDEDAFILWRGDRTFAILNAYPYTTGHLMVMPTRHASDLEELAADEATELWAGVTEAVRALKAAYGPDGINLGANLGRAAGAGVPGHFHIHVLPRWAGDTNFMTSVASARVLPEALPATWGKLHAAWDSLGP